jgi:hypothetical protein
MSSRRARPLRGRARRRARLRDLSRGAAPGRLRAAPSRDPEELHLPSLGGDASSPGRAAADGTPAAELPQVPRRPWLDQPPSHPHGDPGGRPPPSGGLQAGADGVPSFVDPVRPGHGLCEICHQTRGSIPRVATARATSRAIARSATTTRRLPRGGERRQLRGCHAEEATSLARPNLHDRFAGKCSSCHAEVDRSRAGARAEPCADCHSPARVGHARAPGLRSCIAATSRTAATTSG